MKAVVIGASGHCGSYVVPQLVDMGYEVYAISRGVRTPYTADMPQWEGVHRIVYDRKKQGGEVGSLVADLAPDVVCDLISYNMDDITSLMEPLLEKSRKQIHVVQIGTLWVYGTKHFVPVDETHPRNSTGAYGINKTQIERYLHALSAEGKIRSTVLFPGHISGRGWVPINPQGNTNMQTYRDIKVGKKIALPDFGLPTLHHVHSRDIARLLGACLEKPAQSNGQTFNAATARAVTLAGFAEELYAYYGHAPQLELMSREAFLKTIDNGEDMHDTVAHLEFSSHCSMDKAKALLGFEPMYNTIETVTDALQWQEEQGNL